MIVLMQRQIHLNVLSIRDYLLYSDNNNITAEGLKLMPSCNWIQLKWLNLGYNIFIQVVTILAAAVLNC
jgi:hypothetical protein